MLENNLKQAYAKLFKRYNTIAQENQDEIGSHSANKIMQMGITAISNPDRFPAEKMSRWLGFVQGILWQAGFINLKEERDFSRPLIHKAYKDAGLEVPESIDIQKEILDNW